METIVLDYTCIFNFINKNPYATNQEVLLISILDFKKEQNRENRKNLIPEAAMRATSIIITNKFDLKSFAIENQCN